MFRSAGGGLPDVAAGAAAVPEWEVAAPATAAPPTAAPVRAATPSPSFLTLLSMLFLSFDRARPGLANHDAAAALE